MLAAPHVAVAQTARTFNVLAYGAKADGVTDDQAAIAQAIAAAAAWTQAAAGNRATVQLPAGAYNLSQYHGIFAINLVDLHDITFTGGPASAAGYPTQLIGAPPGYNPARDAPLYNSFFNVRGSTDITIENLSLTKQTPYFTQGTVRAADPAARTIDVAIDPGYLDFTNPYVAHLLNLVWFFPGAGLGPDTEIWDHGAAACAPPTPTSPSDHGCTNTHILARRQLAPGLWRLQLDKPAPPGPANQRFLMWKNLGWQPGFLIDRSQNVTVQNIFYTGGGGPGAHIQFSAGGNTIANFRVDIPPGSNALFAATSGFNGSGNRGNITLDNVHVAHVDDDAFHFSAAAYQPVLNANPAGDHLRLAICYDASLRPGDTVALWNWHDKRQVATARVVSSTVVADSDAAKFPRTCDVVLDHGLGAIHNPRTYDPTKLGIETDEDDRLLNLSIQPRLTVERSSFSSMRARCGIIQVATRFTGNSCENTAMAGLLVGPEFSWGEAGSVTQTIIADNTFRNIGGTAIYLANIASSLHTPSYSQITAAAPATDTAQTNTDITIANNKFSGLGAFGYGVMGLRGAAITVQNAKTVRIQNNRIDPATPKFHDTDTPIVISPFTTSGITVQNP